MPVIRMRYSVSSGFLVLVLLLCNEAWFVQAADSGASVSPSAPGFLSGLITYSTSSYMGTMTVTSPTEEASFTSQLKDTPVPSSNPQPSASSSAPAEVMTSTTLPLPSSSQEPPPTTEDLSSEQSPSNVLSATNYGIIFLISIAAMVFIIVMCMSIIVILDKISRVCLNEDHKLPTALTSTGSSEEKTGSSRLVGHHTYDNPIATVHEEEENASRSESQQSTTDVASDNAQGLTGVTSGYSRHQSTSVLSSSTYSPTAVSNYKRYHSAGALRDSCRYLTSGTSDSRFVMAEVHQNPTFVDTVTGPSGQEKLV